MSDADLHRDALIALQILGITTAIAWGLRTTVLPLLKRWAASTASKRDDDAVSRLEVVLDVVIAVCDVLRRIPHLTVGPLPSAQPIARSLPPPPSGDVVMVEAGERIKAGALVALDDSGKAVNARVDDDGVSVAVQRTHPRFDVPSIPTQPLITPPPSSVDGVSGSKKPGVT